MAGDLDYSEAEEFIRPSYKELQKLRTDSEEYEDFEDFLEFERGSAEKTYDGQRIRVEAKKIDRYRLEFHWRHSKILIPCA